MTQEQRPTRAGLDWLRAQTFLNQERARFTEDHPRSAALAVRAREHLLFGVPLHWMNDWGTPFALHVDHASGAQVTDVDGHTWSTSAWATPGPCSAIRRPRWPPPWPARPRAATPPCWPPRTPPWSANSWRSASACRSGSSP
jgi:hypothetical protein